MNDGNKTQMWMMDCRPLINEYIKYCKKNKKDIKYNFIYMTLLEPKEKYT
jgi:hypothetical protein